MSQLTRRDFLRRSAGAAVGLGLIGLAPLAGCASETSSPKSAATAGGAPAGTTPAGGAQPAPTQAAAVASRQKVTVTMAVFTGPEGDAHRRLAPEFEKSTNGEIAVNIEEIARDMYDTKMLAVLQSQTGTYDLALANMPRFVAWSRAGFLAPLDKFFADSSLVDAKKYNLDDYPKAILDGYRWKGELYAIPQEASSMLLFYRKDLLEKYAVRPPGKDGYSWDEYLDAAQKLQAGLRKDGINDVYGTVHSGKRSVHIGNELAQALWSYGGVYLDDRFKPLFTDKKAMDGINMYLSQHLKLKVVPPGIIGYEYPEILTTYQNGKAAMAIEWNAACPTILDAEKSPITAGTTGFSVTPYEKTNGPKTLRIWPSVHAVTLMSSGKHQKEAFRYFSWFTSQGTARDYVTKGGGSSGRGSLLTDSGIVAKNPQYPFLLESFKLYHTLPELPEFQYVHSEIFAVAGNAAMTGQASPEEAMNKAAQEVTSYLTKAGYYK